MAEKLIKLIDLPLFDNSNRIKISHTACTLSLEHWHAAKELLKSNFLPSAVVIHRAQFEAILRSIWLLHAATESHLNKLTNPLTIESEQAAKNTPQTAEMMHALATSGPQQAYEALSRFKENSWKALNSYAHAGIHPLQRHDGGYPIPLIESILRNANGLAVVSCMQASILSGNPYLQKTILNLAMANPDCMPPPL